MTKKFEDKLSESRANLISERKRTSELTRLLKASSTKTAEAQQLLAQYTSSIQRMEARVRDAENRAATASTHVRSRAATGCQTKYRVQIHWAESNYVVGV